MSRRLLTLAATFGFWLLWAWLARLLFLGYHLGRAAELPAGDLAGAFLAGLRLDLSAAAYLSAIPAGLLIATVVPRLAEPAGRAAAWWSAVALAGAALLAAADLELFRHWDRRIDGAALWYLRTPREAWASTGGTPRLLLTALAGALFVAGWLGYRRLVAPRWRGLPRISPWWAPALVAPFGALVVAARGGLQVWPLTQSSGYFSERPFANLAAQNVLWGFFDSLYRGLDDRSNPFATLPAATADSVIAAGTAPAGPPAAPPLGAVRPNLLLLVWEGAGARAVESSGGIPGLTPRLDRLAREGIRFARFYAAGDRTDKGVAAILSGSPALPRGSVMMVPSKARSLPTVSAGLAGAGYATAFLYGGELEFASLRAYLAHAGFHRVTGRGGFPAARRTSKWGAPDGVAAERLLGDLDATPEPFFTVWLTLSSHEPFDVPGAGAGGTWLERYGRSMRYTDSVIGDFVDRARTRPWWERTVVMIVADHGRRLVGADDRAPPNDAEAGYRIPLVWIGGAVTARDSVVDAIGSQLDLGPTLLSLAGVAGGARFRWGRSLLVPVGRPAAYYGFPGGFGLVTESGAALYDRRARRFRSPVPPGDSLRGMAILQRSYQEYLDR